jgi:hypothetical protein
MSSGNLLDAARWGKVKALRDCILPSLLNALRVMPGDGIPKQSVTFGLPATRSTQPDEDRPSKFPIHYVGVGVIAIGVQKRLWEVAHDPKPVFLPEPDRPVIGADHEVELNCPEIPAASMLHGMLAHCTRYSAPCGRRRGHVTAIRDVGAPTPLVCPQIVCAENDAAIFRDEDFVLPAEPLGESILSG